jgi:hypothetical protein
MTLKRTLLPALGLLFTACQAGPSGPLAPPAHGVQFELTVHVDPGQEFERCKFMPAPAEGMSINASQVSYSTGSHHVILYSTNYTAAPTADLQGNPIQFDADGSFDCTGGQIGVLDVAGLVAGAQSANAPKVQLPPGVAIKSNPGTFMLFNVHFLNATSHALDVDVRINLDTIDPSTVTQEAGGVVMYDPFIRVPAHAASQAHMRCPVPTDVKLVAGFGHMHRLGTGFVADLLDDKGNKVTQLYQNDDWGNMPWKTFDGAGMTLTPGQWVDFHCDYQNDTDAVVAQGPTTKNEMCAYAAVYYPRSRDFEDCASAGGGLNSGAVYIGSGTSTCGDAVLCAQGAQDRESLYGCVVDTCPSNGQVLSAALECQFAVTGDGGTCAGCRSNGGCSSCVLTACKTQVDACLAATCN